MAGFFRRSLFVAALTLITSFGIAGCTTGEAEATEPAAEANEPTAASATSSFAISGMHCGSCANSIRETVAELDGVSDCELTFEDQVLTVTWAGEAVGDEQAIIAAVTELGYSAATAEPNAEQPAVGE